MLNLDKENSMNEELEALQRKFCNFCFSECIGQNAVQLLPLYVEFCRIHDSGSSEELRSMWRDFQADMVRALGLKSAVHVLFIVNAQYKLTESKIDYTSLDLGIT